MLRNDVPDQTINQMNYKTILDRSMDKLTQMGHGDLVRKLKYAENMDELHSVLREYVFGSDAKVDAFLDSVKGELQGQAGGIVTTMLDKPVKKCPNCGYVLKESHVCHR